MKFCTTSPTPVPRRPTATMIAGQITATLSFFLEIPIAAAIAEITARTMRILYIHIVMFTSVKPAP